MLKINKGVIVVAAIGYGIYHFFTHNNVTMIPPSRNTVKAAVKKVRPELLTQGHLNVPTGCSRIGGSFLTDGVFACKIELSGKFAEQPGLDKVILIKKNGEWIWKR